MEPDKVVIIKSRGPRRVGLKRTSIQGVSSVSVASPVASDAEPPDMIVEELGVTEKSVTQDQEVDESATMKTEDANVISTDDVVPKPEPMETDEPELITPDLVPDKESSSPNLPEHDLDNSQETPTATVETAVLINNAHLESSCENEEILPDIKSTNGVESNELSAVKEEPSNEVQSEDSDEFTGFNSPVPENEDRPPLIKQFIDIAQSEVEEIDKKIVDDGIKTMEAEDHSFELKDYVKPSPKGTKMGNGIGRKKKKKESGSNFDNMKLLSEVSSEVTSSNDVTTNANDSYAVSDEISSDVTSSATNSPALGVGGIKSPSTGRPKRGARTTKSSVDISDPQFRKPFECGWKRELVYRNNNESSSKVQADVYYYSPSGKKVRSTREIIEHLYGSDLTIENFTFFKEPVGIDDTEKEVIRIAKRVSSVGGGLGFTPKKSTTPKTPKKDSVSVTPPALSPDASEKPGTSKGPSRGFPRIKITPSQLMRGSPSTSKGKGKGKKGQASDGGLVMGMLPPNWTQPSPKAGADADAAPGKKRKREPEAAEATAKRPRRVDEAAPPAECTSSLPMSHSCMLAYGYTAMLNVFQYLKVNELLRAARVCKMWRDLADHPSLWRVVRMKNSQVDDWEGFVTSLVRHGTQQLDLRKMLLPNEPADIDKLWRSFLKEISRATCLSRIDLCRCPAFVVEELAASCPGLAVLNAVAIKCSTINLDSLAKFNNLQELRLKSMTGCHLASNMDAFKSLTSLKHLSLTTFKDLGQAGPEVLGLLTNLESLEIGECSDLDEDFSIKVLSKLTKMSSLRLEKGQGKTCPTFSLLAGVKELPALTQLELVNFDIKAGFSEALAQCTNIKRLLIIPTYVTQSATTNHMVLSAVTELKDTLSHLVWGVTNELLRVTELFIDQCDSAKDANKAKVPKVPKSPDSIPIMKPDTCKNDWDSSDSKSMSSPIGQVKILTLAKLQQVLVKQLPNTKIKILKVPFQSTWRQSISEPMT